MLVGFLKSLLYMLLFFFVFRLFSYLFRFIYFFKSRRFKKNDENVNTENDYALKMLQCEKCKVYVAKSEAYIHNGKVYCKKDHAS